MTTFKTEFLAEGYDMADIQFKINIIKLGNTLMGKWNIFTCKTLERFLKMTKVRKWNGTIVKTFLRRRKYGKGANKWSQ